MTSPEESESHKRLNVSFSLNNQIVADFVYYSLKL